VRHFSYVIELVSLTFAAQRNNRLVWDETYLIMLDLFNNVWGDQKEIVVDHCVDITLQVYLCLSATFQVILSEFQDCAIRYQCCRYRYHTRNLCVPLEFTSPLQDLVVGFTGGMIKLLLSATV
jgi:hypothetical protein